METVQTSSLETLRQKKNQPLKPCESSTYRNVVMYMIALKEHDYN